MEPAEIERVEYYGGNNTSDLIGWYLSGKVDILVGPLGKQLTWLLEHFPDQADLVAEPRYYYVLLRNTSDILSDINVRRALFLALDRKSFSEGVFRTHRKPGYSLISDELASILGGVDDVYPQSYENRLQMAINLMEKAGFDQNNLASIELIVAEEVFGYTQIAGFLEGSWKSIFVDLEVTVLPKFVEAKAQYLDGQGDLMIYSTLGVYPLYFLNSIARDELLTNLVDDAQYRQLIAVANSKLDFTERQKAVAGVDRYAMDKMAVLPIVINESIRFVNPTIDTSKAEFFESSTKDYRRIDEPIAMP